jgi:hypothetical protein
VADTHQERIVLETDRYRIIGDVTLPTEGFHSRLSDLLNREGVEFIAVANARIVTLDGEESEKRPFVAVARDHIHLAYEDR